MRTAWNTVFIESVTVLFYGKFDTQGYKGFFKPNVAKKGFIDLNRIKRSVPKKGFGIDQRMLLKKIYENGKERF